MSEFRLSPEAEAELDDIWLRIARESGSIDGANRVVEKITERFWLLARYPQYARKVLSPLFSRIDFRNKN